MQRLHESLIICLLALIALPTFGQKVDFDKVVTPPEMGTRDFKEYLVQLAWINSPENEALDYEKDLRDFELQGEKRDWMNDIRFSLNLNENNFNRDTVFLTPGAPNANGNSSLNLFPIFNFNASVSLGTFTNRKNKIGVAEQRVKIAEANINQKKLNVRMEILKRYEEYEMQSEILKAVTQAEEDASQIFEFVTDLFKADKAKLEDYNAASTTYHAAVEKRIKAASELNIAKLSIEEMIGISFEEALKMRQ
ncbi:MAG: TolC family protein [Bacteroidota bacterium]